MRSRDSSVFRTWKTNQRRSPIGDARKLPQSRVEPRRKVPIEHTMAEDGVRSKGRIRIALGRITIEIPTDKNLSFRGVPVDATWQDRMGDGAWTWALSTSATRLSLRGWRSLVMGVLASLLFDFPLRRASLTFCGCGFCDCDCTFLFLSVLREKEALTKMTKMMTVDSERASQQASRRIEGKHHIIRHQIMYGDWL